MTLLGLSLHGVTVTINGRAAFVAYISPGQINAQSPSNLQPGQAQVVVNNNGRISSNYQVQVNALQPGLLQLPERIVALTYAAALLPDQSYDYHPDLVFLVSRVVRAWARLLPFTELVSAP